MKYPPTTKKSRSQEAFTLVEILVVISIIAILVTLSLPAINSVMKRRDQVVCLANLKSLGATFYNFAGDNDGKLPPALSSLYPDTYWRIAILPYVGTNTDVYKTPFFTCPQVRALLVKNGENRAINCYAMSEWLSELRLVAISKPSKKILAMEALVSAGGTIPTEFISTNNFDNFPPTYHVGGDNILYVDGHVAFWKDISLLTKMPFSTNGTEDMWSP